MDTSPNVGSLVDQLTKTRAAYAAVRAALAGMVGTGDPAQLTRLRPKLVENQAPAEVITAVDVLIRNPRSP